MNASVCFFVYVLLAMHEDNNTSVKLLVTLIVVGNTRSKDWCYFQ